MKSNPIQTVAHHWPVRIYYEDTDMQGIVYYANYLKYLERARTEFLREKGFEQDLLIEQQGIAFAVRSVAMDYVKPAKFNDELVVITQVKELKRVSLVFQQTVIRPADDNEILNIATIKIASLDAQSMKIKAIPTNMIEQLT